MQKTLKYLLLAVLATLLLILPLSAGAESGSCGDKLSWSMNDAGTLTISGSGKMWDYEAGTAPWGTGVNKLIVEAGVTSIGDYAFYNCSSLSIAQVSNHVATIGDAAFKGCSALKTMQLLNSTQEQTSGDANEDGTVDILDALLMLKHNAGWNVLINDSSTDVNEDGETDLRDVLAILQRDAGWDVGDLPLSDTLLIRMLLAMIVPCDHDGRTELIGATVATYEQEGYTGDLFCKECGELIEAGMTLPKLVELPDTGDSNQPMLWLLMVALSSCALILLRHSKKLKQQ